MNTCIKYIYGSCTEKFKASGLKYFIVLSDYHFLKICVTFQREPFRTMFYIINNSPVLVTKIVLNRLTVFWGE